MLKLLIKKYKDVVVKFVVFSLIISTLLSGVVYYYFTSHRTYSASVSFKFTNAGASDGFANDGTWINYTEILGAEVLSNAIDKYGHPESNLTVDGLAASLTVEQIIPQEEQDKIDSALKNGNEYDYYPVEFKATLTSSEKETAWLMECIAESYYEYYTEQHVAKERLGALADIDGFDYIEIADELRGMLVGDREFLLSANEINPDFRCSANGYLFSDILSEYNLLYNHELPMLYAEILSYKASKNPDLLIKVYEEKIAKNEYTNEDTVASNEIARDLIASYSEKNKSDGTISNGTYGDLIDENHQNIMDYVYENDTRPKSAYDNLIRRFYSELDVISNNEIDTEYYEYLISVFSGTEPISDEAVIEKIENQIEYIYEKSLELHELTKEAKWENDSIQAAKVLKKLNTPYAVTSGHIKIYTGLAFIASNIFLMIALTVLFVLKKRVEAYIRDNYLVY